MCGEFKSSASFWDAPCNHIATPCHSLGSLQTLRTVSFRSCFVFHGILFQQSLFLSGTSRVKHFLYILLTEQQNKKIQEWKTRHEKVRERPEQIVEQVPPPPSQVTLSNTGPGTQPHTGLSEASQGLIKIRLFANVWEGKDFVLGFFCFGNYCTYKELCE